MARARRPRGRRRAGAVARGHRDQRQDDDRRACSSRSCGPPGENAAAVGNVGTPVVLAATDPTLDVLAVELSSFQLHFTHSMSAQAAAVLNVAPDHLDWHGSLDAYAADKGRIFERAQVACVYNLADPRHRGPGPGGRRRRRLRRRRLHARHAAGRPGRPGRGRAGRPRVRAGCGTRTRPSWARSTTWRSWPGRTARCRRTSSRTRSPPPRSPSRTASTPAAVRDGPARLRTGRAPARRRVAVVDGVAYVDDSKATNAHAAAAALGGVPARAASCGSRAAWPRARSSTSSSRPARDRLRAVVLIGVDRAPLRDALARHAPEVPVVEVDAGETGPVMTRAVDEARRLAAAPARRRRSPCCSPPPARRWTSSRRTPRGARRSPPPCVRSAGTSDAPGGGAMTTTTARPGARRPAEPAPSTSSLLGQWNSAVTSYYVLIGATALLLVIGLVMVLSSSSVESLDDGRLAVRGVPRPGEVRAHRSAAAVRAVPGARAVLPGDRLAGAGVRDRVPADRCSRRSAAAPAATRTGSASAGLLRAAVGDHQARAGHLAGRRPDPQAARCCASGSTP